LIVILFGAVPAGAVGAPAADPIAVADASPWQFASTLYGWVPKLSGTVIAPVTGTQENIQMDESDILNHLNLAGQGAFDVHYRQFGVFVDAIYMNLGASKSNFRDFTVGGMGIPASTSAYVNLSLKSWIVTYALEYRFADSSLVTMDVLLGARYFYLKQGVGYVITGAIDSLPPATRSGGPSVSGHRTDPVGGFKGEFHLGNGWGIPAYFDIGGDMTWQVASGVAYRFHWGEVSALYRYLNYYVGQNSAGSLTANGPMLGATLRW
jgi:hypothetical protein